MPQTLRLGPFTMPTYTALLDLGLLGGTALALLEARRRALSAVQVLDVALASVLGGLLAARAAYVASHWDYYQSHLKQAMRLREGGLAWHGALIGGLAAVVVYCAIRRLSLSAMLDALTPGIALFSIFAWLGCLAVGCAYGVEAYPGQGLLWKLSRELPDIYGIKAPRVAVQFLGAGWSAIVLLAVLIAKQRLPKGLVFTLWLTLYSAGSCVLGFVGGDETPLLAGWRIDQMANAGLAVAGATILLVGGVRRRRQAAKCQDADSDSLSSSMRPK